MIKNDVEQLQNLIKKLSARALVHYTQRLEIYTKRDMGLMYTDAKYLNFHSIDEKSINFISSLDPDDFEHVYLEALLDPETDLKNLEHDLLKEKEEKEARVLARKEAAKEKAILQIEEIKRRYEIE